MHKIISIFPKNFNPKPTKNFITKKQSTKPLLQKELKQKRDRILSQFESYKKKISYCEDLDKDVISYLEKRKWTLNRLNLTDWILQKEYKDALFGPGQKVDLTIVFRTPIMSKREMLKTENLEHENYEQSMMNKQTSDQKANLDKIKENQSSQQQQTIFSNTENSSDKYYYDMKSDFLLYVSFDKKKMLNESLLGQLLNKPLDYDGLNQEKADWMFRIDSEDGDFEVKNWGLCDFGEVDMRRDQELSCKENWFGFKGGNQISLSDEFNVLVYELVCRKFGIDEELVKAIEHLTVSRYRQFEEDYLSAFVSNFKIYNNGF